MAAFEGTITITFGDQGENHAGMQKIGIPASEGFNKKDLLKAKQKFETEGFICNLIELGDFLPNNVLEDGSLKIEAPVLVIKGGQKAFVNPDELWKEQVELDYDTKAYMYGRVVNKKARYNLCFDDKGQDPDYQNKKGRIISWKDIPLLSLVRERLVDFFGEKAENLVAESNFYYDIKTCGIGFHGDFERVKVIALRMGETIPFQYQWFHKGLAVGERVNIVVEHGDMYVMSQKAVGYDWKRKTIPTLRHAAGSDKFLTIKEKKKSKKNE